MRPSSAGRSRTRCLSGPLGRDWGEDGDAATERARNGGGSVLAGPFDLGPIMSRAMIADPAGATFSATALNLREGG